MKTHNMKWFFGLMVLALLLPFVNATCTYDSKTDGGADYFGVNTATVNTTVISDTQLFGSYTAFTPRLNFTVPVYDSIVGKAAGATSDLHWETQLNVSPTIVLTNATSGVVVGTGNYTVVNTSTRRWVINWTTSTFSGSDINVTFNRTFVKCSPTVTTPTCDDLVTSPSTVYTASSTNNWLTFAGGGSYGADETFKLNSASVGNSVSGKNWAVTWDYTEKTCEDQGCSTPVNKTLFGVVVTLFVIGMLVFLGFSIYNGADMKTIVYVVVGFVVMLVAMAIINGLITSICAS
jgi:hypothetical protein